MTNYFEETDQMDIYNSLTDYQKGVLDGFLEIANMVEDEIADFAEDELAEYMEDFIAESDKNELSSCTSAEESSEILAKEALVYIERVQQQPRGWVTARALRPQRYMLTPLQKLMLPLRICYIRFCRWGV